MNATPTPSSLAASDLFAEDLRSSPPRIVELRRIFDDAQKAMERCEIAEDEFGEPIPHSVRRALHFAERNLCAEEARVASANAQDQTRTDNELDHVEDAKRAVECVNACAGIADPIAVIAGVRATLESITTTADGVICREMARDILRLLTPQTATEQRENA